jgi:hypothetical protein
VSAYEVVECEKSGNGETAAERLVRRDTHHYGVFQAEGSPARSAQEREQYFAPNARLLRWWL